jgi:hypothetical protein
VFNKNAAERRYFFEANKVMSNSRVWVLCGAVLIVFFIFLFSMSAVFLFWSDVAWHDQQRILQLALILLAVVMMLVLPRSGFSVGVFFLISLVLVVGFISSLCASEPLWALKEWGRYAGLYVLVLVLSGFFERYPFLQWFVLALMAFVAVYQALNLFVAYSAAFISGYFDFSSDLFFTGFVNPRFFGQFQVLVLPVLLALGFYFFERGFLKVSALFLSVLFSQWLMVFLLGARGAFVAIIFSHFILLFLGSRYFKFVGAQFFAAFSGFVFYYLFFKFFPGLLFEGGGEGGREILRGGLSLREILWVDAWAVFESNIFLGVGPMHFSFIYNPVAAHPHQVVLQWLAEWGLVATVASVFLGCLGLFRGAAVVRGVSSEYVDAALWVSILGALILAQVDGVFVMPYTETWLAILIAICLYRWKGVVKINFPQYLFIAIFSVPVVLVLGGVLALEAPNITTIQDAYLQVHPVGLKPRFWSQGWIPMDIFPD